MAIGRFNRTVQFVASVVQALGYLILTHVMFRILGFGATLRFS